MGSERQVLDVGGIDIACVRRGAGPPVLLLHGGMSSADEWDDLAPLLPGFDLIAWDAPGGGHSGDPQEHWHLGDLADCALALVDALGVGPVHLCGLSFGGGLALEVVRRRPRAVRSLALLSAYAGWAGSLSEEEVAARLAGCLAAAESPRLSTTEEARGFVGPSASEEVVERLIQLEARTRPIAYRVLGRAFAEADLREVLPTVAVPTLVVHGTEDQRAGRSVAEALHRGIAGSSLLVLEGVGHCVDLEAPDQLAPALLALWAAADGR